jgi:hypothetical protein
MRKETIDPAEMSFPVGVWSGILFGDVKTVRIDVYYNSHGHPRFIHDAFGAEEIDKFRLVVINEILERNSTDVIWRMHGDAFAISHKDSNCASFKVNYRGIEHDILKKTIQINVEPS